MILHLNWLKPATLPNCDYKVAYRRMGESSYTELETSGNTSGITSGSTDITVSAPACYEGYVQSNCCADNYSSPDKWGINAYSTVSVAISMVASPLKYLATVTSTYANPYDTIITGTFVSDLAGTVSYTLTYPANSTTATVYLSNIAVSANEVISSVGITTIVPQYANGGQLQQLDAVRTPAYFEFYNSSGDTSGATTTYGNPLTLPSFVLEQFNPTETDVSGNVTAGDLLIAWIQDSKYGSGIYPYDTLNFDVTENGSGTILGSGVISTSENGIKNLTISIVKGANNITTSVLYRLTVYWTDDTQPPSPYRTFYLPDF